MKKIKTIIILFIMFIGLLFNYSYAQEKIDTLDSKMWKLDTEINYSENRFFNNAYNMYKSGDYKESLRLYNIYIKNKPAKAMPYYERSLIKLALKDYIGAVRDYQEALKLGLKTLEDSAFRNTPVDVILLAENYSDNAKNEDTGEYYLFGNYRNIFSMENSQKNHNDYGVYLLRNGYYEDAIKHLKIAIKSTPNKYKSYYNLALALYLDEKYEDAINISNDYLEKVYQYNSNDKDAKDGASYINNLKAKCLFKLNKNEEAILIEDKDVFTLAYVDLLNKNYTKAKKTLRLYSRIYKDQYVTEYWTVAYHGEIHNDIAYIEYLNNEFDKAYIDVNEAKKVALEYNDVDVYINAVKLENLILNNLSSEQKKMLDKKI